MLALSLQFLIAALTLAYGALGYAVARRCRGCPPGHRAGWGIIGIAFLAKGGIGVPQSLAAAWAYFAGAGSAVYAGFITWSPVANHVRLFLAIGMALVVLLWFSFARMAPRAEGAGPRALLLACALAGGWAGWRWGAYGWGAEATIEVLLNVLEFLLLSVGLLLALWNTTLDRLLWFSLAVYWLHDALDNLVFVAYLMSSDPEAIFPPPRLLYGISAFSYLPMVVLAALRLRLARRDTAVAAPFAPPREGGIAFR